MNLKHELHRLNLFAIRAILASLVVILFGFIALCLLLNPTLVGVSPESAGGYQGNYIWPIVALLFLSLGLAFVFIVCRWTRRLHWIVRSQDAVPMKLQFEVREDSDSTSYYALLQSPDQAPGKDRWRVSIWLKPASIKADVGNQFFARVYYDPGSAKPAVIVYENGILWAMAGSGSVFKVP
ncbi:MAG: hypothetical protein ACYCZF_10220 [Anaerolineae bacterium]